MAEARRPKIYILSDSLGETAEQMTSAALSLFDADLFQVVRLPKISSRGQLEGVVRAGACEDCVFVYTLADPRLREVMERALRGMAVGTVDLLGPLVGAFANAAHENPEWAPGRYRRTDQAYFERVDALDFAVQHDDGRNPEELSDAEIVLIGVSRTSKTPLSMYLAFKGYRVANLPLVPMSEPPAELFEVDPRRVFGLVTDADLLVEIRRQRLSELGTDAGDYAVREAVERELADSRAVMRRIGCIVVHTGGRAIEETAQEVLRQFECAVPDESAGLRAAAVTPPPAKRSRRRRVPHPGD